MYRNLLGILSVFAVALLLVGLTFSATTERPADFTFINGTEPKSLDPGIMTGQPEGRIADMIFEGLTFRDPVSLRPVPGAAESWDVSADRLRWTFHIRKDAVWSDGTPVTAHDFAWTWRRLQEPALASEYAYILHMVRWAEIFNTYENNARSLIGPLEGETPALEALDERIRSSPGGMPGEAWRTFVKDHHLNEALKGTTNEVLVDALSYAGGALDAEAVSAIRTAIADEGAERRRLAKEAREKLGVSEGVWAEDDHTLVVELKALTPYFLEITAFYPTYPVPRHIVEKPENETDWFMPDKIVSNGPFRLVDWRVNEKIRLVKSETYWNRDAIQLDVVDALPIENVATSLNLYLTGRADWLSGNYPPDLTDDLKTRPDFYKNRGFIVYYYRFNCEQPYLRDPRVRQAICLGIDRQVIVDHIGKLGQQVAHHYVPPLPESSGYEPPPSEVRFDPERARVLLADAGYPGGKGLPELGIVYNTQEGHRKIAENVAFQLRENLGLRVRAYNQEWQAYQQSVRDMDYDMARAGWIGDYVDPNTYLDMWVTNGGNNQTGWSNPLYDRLIQFAADVELFIDDPGPWLPRLKERDRAEALLESVRVAGDDAAARADAAARLRMQLFREAESILVQDAFPIMPIYFYVVSGLVQPQVRGFHTELLLPDGTRTPNIQDIHPIRGIWVEKHENEAR